MYKRTHIHIYIRKYTAYSTFVACCSTYVAVFSSTAPSCFSQADDTFAGDHLLQSFQRLAMILASKTNGIESYRWDTFGEAFTDTPAVFCE